MVFVLEEIKGCLNSLDLIGFQQCSLAAKVEVSAFCSVCDFRFCSAFK